MALEYRPSLCPDVLSYCSVNMVCVLSWYSVFCPDILCSVLIFCVLSHCSGLIFCVLSWYSVFCPTVEPDILHSVLMFCVSVQKFCPDVQCSALCCLLTVLIWQGWRMVYSKQVLEGACVSFIDVYSALCSSFLWLQWSKHTFKGKGHIRCKHNWPLCYCMTCMYVQCSYYTKLWNIDVMVCVCVCVCVCVKMDRQKREMGEK